ncbi:DUF445 family protein [Desulforhopalus sp. IMCC35007]|uniref:DUF445 family protein n=1 Tax=Desulforhopalus sp. IMCC35007 TaxID=2569543 RepID=UPI0010AED5E8|nr:DUF445 family protein [Desulforhopalus sp. IMCC35007]TKB09296.1 DUF445 family protein [Desulforhopalus sp. IMCC35007]
MSQLPVELLEYTKYIAPPVVGAFIGYVTNRIAIKMLFRPLNPWKIAGLRIPMTPGVIPSKRSELAKNMGEVVGDHLLTSEEIGKGLQQQAFQEHLYNVIDGRVKGVLAKDLGNITEIVPEKFKAYLDMGARAVTYQVKGQLRTFIDSEQFEKIVAEAVGDRLDAFLKKEIGLIIPADKREAVYGFIEENIARMFDSEPMAQWVEDFVHQKVYSVLQEEKSLAEVIPISVQELLLDSVEKQIPSFLTKIATIVSEPSVRDRVVAGTCAGVDKFIDSLGGMADMVRGFMRIETVEEKIREYLIEKNDDIVAWLESEEVQKKVVVILRERSQNFINKPIVEWVKTENEEVVRDFCKQCTIQILLLIRSKEVSTVLASMIKSNFENHIDSGGLSTGVVLDKLLGNESAAGTKTWFVKETRQLLQSEHTKTTIDALIDSLASGLLHKRLGRVGLYIPAGVREGISKSFQKIASEVLASEVPGLVYSLNIRKIVTEKVNSLDLLKLEGLLLSIMEEQFKYINLFGGLLGFVIGCLNLFFLYAG